jgi:predicted phosphodiesterase
MRKLPVRLFPLSVSLFLLALVAGIDALTEQRQAPAIEARPPVAKDSVKFLVIGDSGTGDRYQIETAQLMWRARSIFPYDFAIMLGDNMYGSERPQDYARKFEQPFKPLLDAKIEFYASLGNHDDPNQMYYKPFGMGGKRYYTFEKKDVRFFVLDSNYMDRDQQRWLEQELSQSKSKWKIAYFHHPIYSSGGRHGSEVDLRAIVEPLFIKYGLNVVIAGHEHFYERLKPQKGIHYFTSGGAAKLRAGDIRVGPMTAKGFDTDRSFMMVEIDGDMFHFQALSRPGKLIDSGSFTRQNAGGTS